MAQLVEHQTVMREVVSSTPAGPSLRVLKITEEEVLPLKLHLQMVRLSSFIGKGLKTVGPVSRHLHV